MTNGAGTPPACSRAFPVGCPPLSLDLKRGRGNGAHASPSQACSVHGISTVLCWPVVVEMVVEVVVGRREGGSKRRRRRRRGRRVGVGWWAQKWSGALLADSTFLSSHLDILTL